MNGNFKNKVVNILKHTMRISIISSIIASLSILLVVILWYALKDDDGTLKEGDKSNTQNVAKEHTSNTTISTDGKISTNQTAQEVWDGLVEENSRVTAYLEGPEELLKLMNAQMVTQYLDTRENPDEEIDWDKALDVNSKDVQGIVKLKRAQSDGSTITMTYVDPETFQSYIDTYNSTGAESDRNEALKHFTIERTVVANNSANVRPIEAGETINIPAGLGDLHTYMKWQAITSVSSNQYRLIQEAGGMQFDEEGFGRINGRYVIACTLTYGQVGDYIDFYQEDGTIIPCIIGDIKNQNDEGCTEWGHNNGRCIVEFVVDEAWYYDENGGYHTRGYHVNPGTSTCHPEWAYNITKAVNGGSYFDNPNFGTDNIEPNENTDSDTENTDTSTTNTGINGGNLYWPTDSTTITSEFGLRERPTPTASTNHAGIDIGVPESTNVYATEAGTVITAAFNDSEGNYIEIDHGNGYVSRYLHNSEFVVSVGTTVEKGQVIAKSGNTGNSTGPHLHFEIRYNGEAIDPLSFKYHNGMGNGTGGIGETSTSSNSSGNATTNTYYAKVATWNEVTDTVESDDPDVESYSNTTYHMTTTKVNYQEFLTGYTMPFDYLWDILVISEEKEFVLELAELVQNSDIEITIHDNLSINTNVTTNTYTENEKVVSRDVTIVGNSAEQGGQVESASPDETDEQVTSTDRKVVHTVITTTNTIETALTKANVWIVNYTKQYTYEIPDNVETTGGAGDMEDIPYTDEPAHTTQTDDIGFGESQRQTYHNQWVQQYPDINTTLQTVYCDYYYSTTNRNETITNTLERKNYVSSPPTIEEKTDPNVEEPNFVTLLEEHTKTKTALSGDTYLVFIDMLEKNDSTKEMIDLTKYLLYKTTGNTFFWNEDEQFDFSIFDPANFNKNTNGSSGIDGVQGQIYDYFLQKGVPAVGVAAIMGNIEAESSFNPAVVSDSGEYIGLCQWSAGRIDNLNTLANSKGKDWTDLEVQLDFIWQELNGEYSDVKAVLMSATDESDLEYATWYYGRYYEIYFIGTWPSSKAESQERYEFAKNWYEQYKQNSTSVGIMTGEGAVYFQGDYANVPYGDDTISGSGCGPTCFAMIATDYSGRQITPADAVAWCGNAYYVAGRGTSWSYYGAAAEYFNLPCTVVQLGNDINAAVEQLRRGNLVISSQATGIFTPNYGHFIVLSSVDSNGGIRVRDPNKTNAIQRGYNSRTFTAAEISASAKNYWAFVRN